MKADTVSIRRFSWGTLRTIRVGPRGIYSSIVIHPPEASQIAGLRDGGETAFVEETGKLWIVERMGSRLIFTQGSRRVTVERRLLFLSESE